MKLLILGGTRFVGRHLVTAALERNHEITLFNRGKHPSAALTNVETIYGDRNSDLTALQGRRWVSAGLPLRESVACDGPIHVE